MHYTALSLFGLVTLLTTVLAASHNTTAQAPVTALRGDYKHGHHHHPRPIAVENTMLPHSSSIVKPAKPKIHDWQADFAAALGKLVALKKSKIAAKQAGIPRTKEDLSKERTHAEVLYADVVRIAVEAKACGLWPKNEKELAKFNSALERTMSD